MAKEPRKGLTLDEDLIRRLAALLDETGLGEIELAEGDSAVRVARPASGAAPVYASGPAPAAVAQAPAAAAPAAGEDLSQHPGAVTSPMVGVCYLSPDPKSPVFVTQGASVKQGDTLLLIEAMKVFNPITAPKSGTIAKILVNDGTPVEFGEPLVIIE